MHSSTVVRAKQAKQESRIADTMQEKEEKKNHLRKSSHPYSSLSMLYNSKPPPPLLFNPASFSLKKTMPHFILKTCHASFLSEKCHNVALTRIDLPPLAGLGPSLHTGWLGLHTRRARVRRTSIHTSTHACEEAHNQTFFM
jgi:hypothetical protein